MNADVKKWLDWAKGDLHTAQYLYNGKKYKDASLFCQQAAEKALKALLLKKTGTIRKIHDLFELGKNVGVPPHILDSVKELTLAYIYSRYPDVKQETNLKEKATRFLDVAKEVLTWVEENL